MKLKRKVVPIEEVIAEKIVEDAKREENKEKKEIKTLYDIVDHNRLFSMLYSGVEDENNFNILYDMGIRNFLISYHYVQKKRTSMSQYKEMGIKFFVDSGAFTYINSLEYKDYSIEQWEDQIKHYIKWAENNKECIFAIANLDLEYLVGGEQVQKWNEKYFEPFMLKTGIPVCFVHHEEATKLTFEQYCERYPYVGISWGGVDKQGSDIRYGTEKLRIAEKYHCVVHGMAMTQTSLLTQLPFYTVDSTTWLVGLQYGEVNYWNNNKMSRLKKDKWKGSMLSNLVAKGFNEEKLLAEDKEELVKVNVYAFIEAEKYVQDRLKSRMYWLRPEIEKRKDLSDIKYPTSEELIKDLDSCWIEYAKQFNISTEESEKVNIQNIITDLTCIMNWDDPNYAEIISEVYTDDVISEIHNTWINRIVDSKEQKIEDLKKFFTEVLMGENDKLLMIGTNFDRIVKERDDYITDDEYEEEDLSDVEVLNKLQKYLPLKEDGTASEISDLDDEIFDMEGIIPVRDEKGRFLKGQTKVLKPKKMYSNKYPKLSCDMCFNAQKCPEYKAGYVCAFNKMFDRYNTRDMGDIIQAMQGLAEYQLVRTQRAMLSETMNGGIPDANTSAMMQQAMSMMNNLKAMYDASSREVLRQTKVIRSDGSQETSTQITNPQRGGILESLFSNMGSDDNEEEVVVESTSTTQEEE